MNRIAFIIALALAFIAAATPKAKEVKIVRTDWVAHEIDQFERGYEQRAAFSRPYAWGKGTYAGKSVEWFAYTNSDAYMQVDFTTKVLPDDQERLVLISGPGEIGRGWEVKTELDPKNYGVGTKTWLGTDNRWIESTLCKGNECDHRKIIDTYLSLINTRLAGKMKLEVIEYLE